MTADVPDLAAALREPFEAARSRREQRLLDNLPCPECGGDRLRADFTTPGRCHVPRADLTADWTTCLVVRDRDGDLWTRDRAAGWRNRWRDYFAHDTWLDEDRGPLVPVLDADGLPVVATVGDLTARHIGRVVRWADGEGWLEFIGAGRCRLECLLDLDGRENPRTYGAWLDLDTACELLP